MFRTAKVAVFVDGCYWHGCPEHYVEPATNRGYWSEKISGNVARDRDTDRRLAEAGWKVLRYWEHEDLDAAVDDIVEVVTARRPGRPRQARATSH